MGTKFVSGKPDVQAPLVKKDTAFGSKVSKDMDMLRSDQSRHVSPTVLAIIEALKAEGWNAGVHPDGIRIQDDGSVYIRSYEWLMGCDYSDVMGPLAADITSAMQARGFCL